MIWTSHLLILKPTNTEQFLSKGRVDFNVEELGLRDKGGSE